MEKKAFLTRFLQAVAEDLKIPRGVGNASDKNRNKEENKKDEEEDKKDE